MATQAMSSEKAVDTSVNAWLSMHKDEAARLGRPAIVALFVTQLIVEATDALAQDKRGRATVLLGQAKYVLRSIIKY